MAHGHQASCKDRLQLEQAQMQHRGPGPDLPKQGTTSRPLPPWLSTLTQHGLTPGSPLTLCSGEVHTTWQG